MVEMKERPILMTPANAQKCYEGTKTQTRRIVKERNPYVYVEPHYDEHGAVVLAMDKEGDYYKYCPYGQVGDRLWVITLKPIAFGAGKYAAGDDGNIYDVSNVHPVRRKVFVTKKDYEEVSLRTNGERRTFRVNRLVAEAFYGSATAELPVCRHMDGNRRNNIPQNLDWGTDAQNTADANATGVWSGSLNGGCRLTPENIQIIRSSNEPQAVLASRFSVTQPTISKIKSGKRWRTDRPDAPPRNIEQWNSRTVVELTEIRVERVQEISEEDALAEGVRRIDHGREYYFSAMRDESDHRNWVDPTDAYKELWESIHGKGSWELNPWVWVLEFRRSQS